jgi:predicted ArsR family transcriptional regulator
MTEATGEDRLSETFAALASSTRRAILARLAEGEATVNELAEPFELTLPAISKHIKVLERAGLVVQAGGPSTGRASWTPRRWRKSRPGPSGTGRSGKPASTGWTSTRTTPAPAKGRQRG